MDDTAFTPLNYYTGKQPGDEGYSQFLDGGGAYVYDLARQLGFQGEKTITTGEGDNTQATENPEILDFLKSKGYEVRAAGHDGSKMTFKLFKDGKPTEYQTTADQNDTDWFNTALAMAGGVTAANIAGAGLVGTGGAAASAPTATPAASIASGGLPTNSIGLLGAGSPELAVVGGSGLSDAALAASLGVPEVGAGAAALGSAAAPGGAAPGGAAPGSYSAAQNYGPGMSGAQTSAYDGVLNATGSPALANAAGGLPTSVLDGASAVGNAVSNVGLGDIAKIAATGLGVAGLSKALDGPSGETGADSRLLDAQINSLGVQDDAIKRLLANSDRLLPLQEQQLQFGLDAMRTGYEQNQADRGWFMGQRNTLTGLNSRIASDAASFNSGQRGNELAGQAAADVTRSFDSMRDSAARQLQRSGVNPNSGKFGSMIKQIGINEALGKAGAMTQARTQARNEGYALTDRAHAAFSGAPGAMSQLTGQGATLAASGLGLTNAGLTGMNSGPQSAATIAAQKGANATSMYGTQANVYNQSDRSSDWMGLLGAGLGAATRIWSDPRLKTDITPVGLTPGGNTLYSYRYKWSPVKRVGVMADEVAHIPGAVEVVGGYGRVDYSLID